MPFRLIDAEVAEAAAWVADELTDAQQSAMSATELASYRTQLANATETLASRRTDLIGQQFEVQQMTSHLIGLIVAGDDERAEKVADDLESARTVRTQMAEKLESAELHRSAIHQDMVNDMGTASAYEHLDRQTPVALLPVRLETRYFSKDTQSFELRVRIFPDDIHVDAHQRLISKAEDRLARAYWEERLASGPYSAETQGAWQAMADRLGPGRAALVAGSLDPFGKGGRYDAGDESQTPAVPAANIGPEGWTEPARARALPDRWAIAGYRGDQRVVLGWTQPVRPDLALSPRSGFPGEELSDDDTSGATSGIEWLTGFAEAENVGMAARLTVDKTIARSMDRLIVFGVRASSTPEDSAGELADLLQGHSADRLDLLEVGRPSNNTDTVKSDFRGRETDHAASHAAFLANEPSPTDDRNQTRVAKAFGLPSAALRHAGGARGQSDRPAASMNAALWATTLGTLLRDHVETTFDYHDLEFARRLFIHHVRPSGPYPALRVGAQPYGVLPVVPLERWRLNQEDTRGVMLVNFLRSVRNRLHSRIGSVAQTFDTIDPQRALIDVLSQPAVGDVREMRGAQFDPISRAQSTESRMRGFWDAVFPDLLQGNVDLVDQHGGARISDRASLTYGPVQEADDVSAPMVSGQIDRQAPLEHKFLSVLAAQQANPNQVMNYQLDGAATGSILYRLVAGSYIQTFLDPSDPNRADFFAALHVLKDQSVETLEHALSALLDTLSHRIDPWIGAVASRRLAECRGVRPEGLHLGGYGWIEGLVPPGTPPEPNAPIADDPDSAGYIHMPSPGQAKSAAVLHGGHLAHADQRSGEKLSLQLTSERVRQGRWLLDGMRSGQTLGALLGYRIERTLSESGPSAAQQLLELRRLAPQRASTADIDGAEVAQINVLDGLRVLEMDRGGNLEAALGAVALSEIRPALDIAAAALDAVSDLLIAEGVLQTTEGNSSRAGAVLDAMAEGRGQIPEPEIVKTQTGGVSIGHRLMIVLPEKAQPSWPGDESRMRAIAEPRMNGWAAGLFGSPSQIAFEAVFTAADGAETRRAYTLDQFDLCPLDLVHLSAPRFAAAPVVVLIGHKLRHDGPEGTGGFEGEIVISGSDPSSEAARPFDEVLAMADEVRRILSAARPLEAGDLALKGADPAFDNAEISARATALQNQFDVLRTAFNSAPSDLAVWWEAALIAGPVDPSLPSAQASLSSTLNRRNDAAAALSSESALDRMHALLGRDFAILPCLSSTGPGELDAALANQAALTGNDPLWLKQWLEDYARVRPACDAMDMLLTAAKLRGASSDLRVFQLPWMPSRGW
ncbi:MAG: hypothetical protein AAGH68_09485, partial [Pseudomonadota bacterium]